MQTSHGSLARISLPEILRQCTLKQSTGTLTLNRGKIEKKLYFNKGKLDYIASNKSGERLGEFLVHKGDLTRSWASFLLKDSERRGIGFTTSLLKKNILNEDDLSRVFSRLAAKAVADAISWTSGSFEFNPKLPEEVVRGPVKISEEDVISAALQSDTGQGSTDEKLIRTIAQKMATRSFYMPLLPSLVAKLEKLWRNQENEQIIAIARADQVLTVHVLRVLNAGDNTLEDACFSFSDAQQHYSAEHLSGIIRSKATTADRPHQPDTVAQLQQHALSCALLSEKIATQLGEDPELAYTCALLHNVGKVALLQLLDDNVSKEINVSAQMKKLHQNTGALLARRWNLHSAVYATIRHYANPGEAEENALMAQIVHLSHHMLQNPERLEPCKEQCPGINFDQLHIDALKANLSEIDELAAAAFSL